MLPSLKIAGIDISVVAWLNLDQRIEPFGGNSTRRMASGGALKMSRWRKYRISLSASGWIPPALNAIDYNAPFEIELPKPISLNSAETLPPGFTSRAAPWAELSVTDQAGETQRHVFVKATVIAEPPAQSYGSDPSWDLVCELV